MDRRRVYLDSTKSGGVKSSTLAVSATPLQLCTLLRTLSREIPPERELGGFENGWTRWSEEEE